MTPNEELHVKFFNQEIQAIADMDMLARRARLEELQAIAAETRARAAAHVEHDRREKGKNKGLFKPVEIDDFTKETINRVNVRRERMSKEEKLKQNMMAKLGLDEKAVNSLMSASKLIEAKTAPAPEKTNVFNKEPKAAFNPFAPKKVEPEVVEPEPEHNEVVTIIEETHTTIIVTQEEKPKEVFNPFKK